MMGASRGASRRRRHRQNNVHRHHLPCGRSCRTFSREGGVPVMLRLGCKDQGRLGYKNSGIDFGFVCMCVMRGQVARSKKLKKKSIQALPLPHRIPVLLIRRFFSHLVASAGETPETPRASALTRT